MLKKMAIIVTLCFVSHYASASTLRCSTMVNGEVVNMGIFTGENVKAAMEKARDKAEQLGGDSVFCTPA